MACRLLVRHSTRTAALPSCSSLLFTWECFFCSSSCLMVSSPKTWSFVYHLTLDKSISGLTALISPMFTRRSYLLLTVGVLTFISREIARNDFWSSSINDFRIATSKSSRSTGNILCVLNSTAIPSFSYYKEEVKVGIAYFSHFSTSHITGERDEICICVTSSWQIIIC